MNKNPAAHIQPLLKAAALRADQAGQRWTSSRAITYEKLLNAAQPMTAYALRDALSESEGRDVKPASVYRALEALCALGLAVRIESINAFTACRHPEHDHQHVMMVCNGCGQAHEMSDNNIGLKLHDHAAARGFKTERQVLELHGSCSDCQD